MSDLAQAVEQIVPGLAPIQHPLAEMIKLDPARDTTSCCCNSAPRIAALMTLDNEHPLLFCGHHAAEHAEKIRDALAWRYVR